MGDGQFDDFAASEPQSPTTQPMADEEIVNLVHTENDAQEDESKDEEEAPSAKLIKSTTEFLAIIDQQKAFIKRNNLPVELFE